jgi:hypothetical protein
MHERVESAVKREPLAGYRANLFATLLMLVAQFLLGMAVNFSSVIMASGFAVAVVAYLIGLYLLPRSPTSSGSR